jgi:hypothetical protein
MFFRLVRNGTPVNIALTQPEDSTLGKDFPWPPSAESLTDHPNSYYLSDKYFTDHKPPTFQLVGGAALADAARWAFRDAAAVMPVLGAG